MVQVINDETRNSILGRLGKGLGQGLSEQLPKEVERYRLSSGLKDLAQNSQGLSPLEQASKYLSIPGITPAAIQILPDLLRQQGIRNEGPVIQNQNNSTTGFKASPHIESSNAKNIGKQTSNAIQEVSNNQKYMNQFRGLTNPEDIQRSRLPTRTQGEIELRAHDLMNKFPQRFRTIESALQHAKEEEASDIKQFDTAKQKRLNDLGIQNSTLDGLHKATSQLLQKQGPESFQDISGEAQKVFDQIALDQVAAGKTPEAAAEDVAQQALNFAKTRNNMKTFGESVLTKASDQLIKDLTSAREQYKKYNQLPQFVEDSQNFNGLGPHLASSIAYPASDNLQKSVNILKSNEKHVKSPLKPSVQQALSNIPGGPKNEIKSKKNIEQLANSISPEDSIFTLGMMLHDSNWDDVDAINQLNALSTLGKFHPTPNQQRELDKYTGLDFTLGDLFQGASMGFFGKTKVPYKDMIRRKFWGKR